MIHTNNSQSRAAEAVLADHTMIFPWGYVAEDSSRQVIYEIPVDWIYKDVAFGLAGELWKGRLLTLSQNPLRFPC